MLCKTQKLFQFLLTEFKILVLSRDDTKGKIEAKNIIRAKRKKSEVSKTITLAFFNIQIKIIQITSKNTATLYMGVLKMIHHVKNVFLKNCSFHTYNVKLMIM